MPPLFPHLLCFLLLLLPFSITLAQTSNKISLGSALSTLEPTPYWSSPSGEFAFGFYPLQDKENFFLLAVWFAKIPIKTIVWTANGDQPVQKGSRVQLTTNTGTLSHINSTGVEIWKAEPLDGTRASSASMLDTGNFVLFSSDSSIKWATFDQPTDTILPTQILNRGEKLLSRRTELDYSTGRFQLALQLDRDLVLYTMARQTKDSYTSYWSSNTKNSGSQLLFNQNGDLFLALLNGKIFNFTTKSSVSTRDYYHRATLDFDGVFRKYTYPKIPTKDMNWPQSWAVSWFIPSEICTAVLGENGSGVCGFNSYCILDQEQRPQCKCPPGYDYLNPKDTFRGCKQVFGPQSCEEDNDDVNVITTRGFEMRTMLNTDWPLCDYEHFELVNEEWCSETCLKDCFCAVSIFREGNCWLKKFPLSNGRMDTSVGGKAFVKVGSARNCSP